MNLPSIRQIWHKLGLPGDPPAQDKRDCTCPFPDRHNHGDRRPSFALLNDGMTFKCQGCGVGGGVIDLVVEALTCTRPDAAKWVRKNYEMPDFRSGRVQPIHRTSINQVPAPSDAPPALMECPFDLVEPTDDLRKAAAQSRGLDPAAFYWCEQCGVVCYGNYDNHEVWILRSEPEPPSEQSRIYEARRTDGLKFPATARLPERKTHTRCLPGGKGWPIGTRFIAAFPGAVVLLVEGSADYVAAMQICWEIKAVPVAILGSNRIHPGALHFMNGRRVIIAAHADENGKGRAAAREWAKQLRGVSCKVAALQFPAGLDLNDMVVAGHANEIREVLK